jgi:DNA-directed RNA polymerase subunit RPC12/RpoP
MVGVGRYGNDRRFAVGKHVLEACEVWTCTSCDESFDAADVDADDKIYECGDCGPFMKSETDTDNHQCPECHHFGSKVKDFSGVPCPDCGADGELDGPKEGLICLSCNRVFLQEPIGEECECS